MKAQHFNDRTLFGDTLDFAFVEWVVDHPDIVGAFVKFTREKANRGERVGAKAVAERLRWESDLGSINNSYVSRLARYVMREYPDLAGYFNVRELRAA